MVFRRMVIALGFGGALICARGTFAHAEYGRPRYHCRRHQPPRLEKLKLPEDPSTPSGPVLEWAGFRTVVIAKIA